MAFSKVKISGWAFGEILTSAQMNTLDTDHANAVDGAAGGSYVLSAPLAIEGDTVTFDDLVLNNQLTAVQAVVEALQVNALATIGTNLTVGNDLTTEDCTVTDDLTVGGKTSLGQL